jgi:hypothetical protein
LEFVTALVHGEWLHLIVSFVGLAMLMTAALHWNQLKELASTQTPIGYRIMLGGLLAVHGRTAVVHALAESWSGNVVSIAAASKWCRRPGRMTTIKKQARRWNR